MTSAARWRTEAKSSQRINLPRKDRAIDVAIEALRGLFETHTSLLSEPERGMRLILGLPEKD